MEASLLLPPARIAIVGLGRMGLPMASNLACAGYRIPAHDLSGEALRRAREEARTDGNVGRAADTLSQ